MAELTVPRLDFSSLGDLPATYRDARKHATREAALAELGQGGPINYSDAARRLFAAGLAQEGMSLAQLGNNERDFGFRQTEAQRAQQNADRSHGLQERQLGVSAANTAAMRDLQRQQFEFQKEQGNRPDIQIVENASGQKVPMLIDRKTGAISQPPVPGATGAANNPFITGGPMKDEESKAALYTNRMLKSEKVLRGVEAAGTSWWERHKGLMSDKTGYNMRGPEFQKFDQAQRDFINATLRRESGAVISDSEFDNANKQYFPMPGDTQDVIEQKRANRMEAIKGIGAGAGRGYRPESSFDAQGNIVPRGQPQAQNPSGAPQVGEVRQGYRFNGGDPADQANWIKQ
jgi:hypothetical protein